MSFYMTENISQAIVAEFNNFVENKNYPCVAARAASYRRQIACYVAHHMECSHEDAEILRFLYGFIENFRKSTTTLHSAAVIFAAPEETNESMFDSLLWQRLQNLARLDAERFACDPRVNPDPSAADFSFSIGEEAFFIIGLHSGSVRLSRRFRYPTLVFNPHVQFEKLRHLGQYGKLKQIIRKRDLKYSGSVNPMLSDFGESSEAFQYSGREYGPDWKCPLTITHGNTFDNPAEK